MCMMMMTSDMLECSCIDRSPHLGGMSEDKGQERGLDEPG